MHPTRPDDQVMELTPPDRDDRAPDVPFIRPSDMLAGQPLPGWSGRFVP